MSKIFIKAAYLALITLCISSAEAQERVGTSKTTLSQATFQFNNPIRTMETQIFYEGFNSGVSSGWLNLDQDGDGYKWAAGTTEKLQPFAGANSVLSLSYTNDGKKALTPDNWLISPAIVASGQQVNLEYYTVCSNPDYAREKYSICVSTSGTDVADFTEIFTETLTSDNHNWTFRNIPLTILDDYDGTFYIAFRHHNCTNQHFIGIDEMRVYEGSRPCPVVRNLSYTQYGAGAFIAWEAPEGEAPTGYRIYNGRIEITTVYNATNYTFTDLGAGIHTLGVAAFYEGKDCVSEKVAIQAQIKSCPEVANITVNYTEECKADISWTAPSVSSRSDILYNQREIGGYGYSQVISWWKTNNINTGCAAADDFDAEEGWIIEEIGFRGWHYPTASGGIAPDAFRIAIYNDNKNEIGEELYLNDNLHYTVDYEDTEAGDYIGFFEIQLSEPFEIEESGKYWIAISGVYNTHMPTTAEEVIATRFLIDFGDIHYGQKMRWKGEGEDLYSSHPNWQVLQDSGGGTGDPYAMSLVVQGSTPQITAPKYNVYRDGILIASELETVNYTDEDFDAATSHEWAVTVACPRGGESIRNHVEKEACSLVVITNPLAESLRIYPNPASSTVNIFGEELHRVEIYNTVGQLIEIKEGHIRLVDVSSYNVGLYFFKVYDSNNHVALKRLMIAR